MTNIEVDQKNRRVHVCFADGVSGTIPFVEVAILKGQPVELDWNLLKLPAPYYFTVPITSDTTAIVGHQEPLMDVPWDFMRDACDTGFKGQAVERERRSRVSLGQRVQELRKDRGLTQEALSGQARINRVTLADLERGDEQNPQLQTLKKIAKALGVDLVDLVAK